MGVDTGRAAQLARTAPYAPQDGDDRHGPEDDASGEPRLHALHEGAGGSAATGEHQTLETRGARALPVSPAARSPAPAAVPAQQGPTVPPLPSLEGVDVVLVVPDSDQRLPAALEAALQQLPCPAHVLLLPPPVELQQLRAAPELAQTLVAAAVEAVVEHAAAVAAAAAASAASSRPSGTGFMSRRRRLTAAATSTTSAPTTHQPLLSAAVIGVGYAASVAFEVAVQLQQQQPLVTTPSTPSSTTPPSASPQRLGCSVLMLLEDPRLRRCAQAVVQPWFQLHGWLRGWLPGMDAGEFRAVGRLLEQQGHTAQMNYVAGLCPPGLTRAQWERMCEGQVRAAALHAGYGWEELQYSWSMLYGMVQDMQRQAAELAAAEGSREEGGGMPGGSAAAEVTDASVGSFVAAVEADADAEAFEPLPDWESFLLEMYELVDRWAGRTSMGLASGVVRY